MQNNNIGAGLLSIITESLYDKPIVVFREYVQNSADSFDKLKESSPDSNVTINIWSDDDNLYFLDNGLGINFDLFHKTMISIGNSSKQQAVNKGYKGIGRLSGLSYCEKLVFININSASSYKFQSYCIDNSKYKSLKKDKSLEGMSFESLMEKIGAYENSNTNIFLDSIRKIIDQHPEMFHDTDTGFLVILDTISPVLKSTMQSNDFIPNLEWLLPLNFNPELFSDTNNNLFIDLTTPNANTAIVPAQGYPVLFNNYALTRPINNNMLRKYQCKTRFDDFAIGFHSFAQDRIYINRNNSFSGIRLYIDNILLCDENELIPILKQYGFINHSVNELLQTVQGVGAMIYITDKVNITSNARRTFIEITDADTLTFLKLLAKFIDDIYNARYSLSKYHNAKQVIDFSQEKLEKLKSEALNSLITLANEEVTIEPISDKPFDFDDLSNIEKKQRIKEKISKHVNLNLRNYLSQLTEYDYSLAINNFLLWLTSNDDHMDK